MKKPKKVKKVTSEPKGKMQPTPNKSHTRRYGKPKPKVD